jgi:hypothetical protein
MVRSANRINWDHSDRIIQRSSLALGASWPDEPDLQELRKLLSAETADELVRWVRNMLASMGTPSRSLVNTS